MAEITVLLMLFDPKDRRFNAFKEMKLPSVPSKEDKIALNDDQALATCIVSMIPTTAKRALLSTSFVWEQSLSITQQGTQI